MEETGDRRREARLPVPWHLTGAGLELLLGYLVDLSPLGARIEHTEPLEEGLVCEVDLPPALGRGRLRGRVVWTKLARRPLRGTPGSSTRPASPSWTLRRSSGRRWRPRSKFSRQANDPRYHVRCDDDPCRVRFVPGGQDHLHRRRSKARPMPASAGWATAATLAVASRRGVTGPCAGSTQSQKALHGRPYTIRRC
jgi:hypothetical protein